MKVGGGFLGGGFFDAALDDHLALKREPRKEQADLRVGIHVIALAAVVIGKKYEASFIKALQQDRALKGAEGGVDRGKGHGVWFMDAEIGGCFEPFAKLLNGIRVEVGATQAAVGVFLTKIGQIHGSWVSVESPGCKVIIGVSESEAGLGVASGGFRE